MYIREFLFEYLVESYIQLWEMTRIVNATKIFILQIPKDGKMVYLTFSDWMNVPFSQNHYFIISLLKLLKKINNNWVS